MVGSAARAASVVPYAGVRLHTLAISDLRVRRFAETLYSVLQRNAVAADRHFGIPPTQVVEIGTQVDL